MSQSFVHLHTHTDYSMLDGAARLKPLMEAVVADNQPAIAITDHGNMFGAFDFYKQARAHGLNPIIGIEAYMTPGTQARQVKSPVLFASGGPDDVSAAGAYTHMTMWAATTEGMHNLFRISSRSWLDGFYKKPRGDRDLLVEYGKGVIATTGCPSGEVQTYLRLGMFDKAVQAAADFRDILGEGNFFVELMDHDLAIERRVRDDLLRLASHLGLPLVATNDLHYVSRDQAEAHDSLLCINSGSRLADADRFRFDNDTYYLRSADEMRLLFANLTQACDNTLAIAERCRVEFDEGANLMPQFDVPDGETEETWFVKEVQSGLARRYPNGIPAASQQRADYEVDVIRGKGYCGYYLVVADFIQWAKSQGIRVGPGRGSGAGSMAAYAMRITDLDPIEHDLLFERFLNPERMSMPDFDIDFDERRRGEVIQYVTDKYGQDRVSQIVTMQTIKARAAIKDSVRIHGLPYDLGEKANKQYPADIMGKGMPLTGLYDTSHPRYVEGADFREFAEKNVEMPTVLRTAQGVEGLKRTTGVHAAGVIMSKARLIDHIPIMLRPDDGAIITQFENEWCESLGLVKMDFLGLSNLTIIDDAVKNIEQNRGVKIDLDTLPLDDAATYRTLANGEGIGVFQCECVDGKTLVGGEPIEVLYQRQQEGTLRERTRSIYLDEGRVRWNRINRIVKTGRKTVFQMVVDHDGRLIRATAGHRFMTIDGWKELRDLKPGDRVVVMDKAKSQHYRTCPDCGTQTNMAATVKNPTSRCYSCSARFHANPSKEHSRAAFREAMRRTMAEGRTPWNLGLTSETDPRQKAAGEAISKASRGRTWEERYGPERAAGFRRETSARMSGRNNHMFGKPSPNAKRGYREDLGHYVRSSWEADYARVLNYLSEPYEYEPKTFLLIDEDGTEMNYTPDFYLPQQDQWVEIKGFMRPLDQKKIDLFREQYPDHALSVVSATRFAEFELEFRDLVAWECPVMPESSTWATIQSIEEIGESETYDIAMDGPAHNYIANGFMVHNSGGIRSLLRRIAPTEFKHLDATLALYRPGPMGANAHLDYADRKNGRQQVTPIHPELAKPLEQALGSTYGLIVYQEQVMEIAQILAGYSLGQADLLRRAMGKKKKEVLDREFEPFRDGMLANGYSQDAIDTLWAILVPFSDYAFNKAHTAAYGLISYWTAWLKTHYPVEYMAALLTGAKGKRGDAAIFLAEARRMKINLAVPDVNESIGPYSAVGDTIRVGLSAVVNISDAAAAAIVAERTRNGPFSDFLDFVQRVDVKAAGLDSLIRAGAFDFTGHPRRALASVADAALQTAAGLKKARAIGQDDLFADLDDDTAAGDVTVLIPQVDEWPRRTLLGLEREQIGLYVSDHPLRPVAGNLAALGTHRLADLHASNETGHKVTIAGGLASVDKKVSKKGQSWAALTLEDLDTSIEVLCFPRTYEIVAEHLLVDAIVTIHGRVDREEDGTAKIIAETVQTPELEEDGSQPIYLHCRIQDITASNVDHIKVVASTNPGNRPLRLRVLHTSGEITTYALPPEFRIAVNDRTMSEFKEVFGAGCFDAGPSEALAGA